ncbi:MAG: creatininase family protein [Halomonas sp.]|nr:creatininase family protein [Halomonas sp.]
MSPSPRDTPAETPPAFPHWQDLTTPELAELPEESVAVMVLGAIEQHGAHLPLSTDLDIGEGLHHGLHGGALETALKPRLAEARRRRRPVGQDTQTPRSQPVRQRQPAS